jgi:hypothetical protein
LDGGYYIMADACTDQRVETERGPEVCKWIGGRESRLHGEGG